MAKVSTYLNFEGNTEEAFMFYKSVFGTEFAAPIMRLGDVPPQPGMPPPSDADKVKVMHVELPTLGEHSLMGTDVVEGLGQSLTVGNNVHIMLQPDSRKAADGLFAALGAGGQVGMPLQDMFWGAYYGALTDKYGVHWMVNVANAG